MPLIANFEIEQGTDCTAFTLIDTTSGYDSENIPAQRAEYEEIVPANTSGKTNVRLVFTSGATTVNLNVAILSGDTVAQKVTKITNAINGNATIAAIVTAVDATTKVTVTADADDVAFNFTAEIEEGTDNACTITEFPFSTRTVTVLYPDGETDTYNFPYGDGYGDELQITGLDKDYVVDVTMTITPQVEVENSQYSFENVVVLTCNTDACYNTLTSNLQINIGDEACASSLQKRMTKINNYVTAAHDKANVAGGQANAQFWLDQIQNICNGNCGC